MNFQKLDPPRFVSLFREDPGGCAPPKREGKPRKRNQRSDVRLSLVLIGLSCQTAFCFSAIILLCVLGVGRKKKCSPIPAPPHGDWKVFISKPDDLDSIEKMLHWHRREGWCLHQIHACGGGGGDGLWGRALGTEVAGVHTDTRSSVARAAALPPDVHRGLRVVYTTIIFSHATFCFSRSWELPHLFICFVSSVLTTNPSSNSPTEIWNASQGSRYVITCQLLPCLISESWLLYLKPGVPWLVGRMVKGIPVMTVKRSLTYSCAAGLASNQQAQIGARWLRVPGGKSPRKKMEPMDSSTCLLRYE